MSSQRRIEISLFNLLMGVGQMIEKIVKKATHEENDQLILMKIRDNLITFCKNFLIQFFYNGYGFLIDGFNYTTVWKLNNFFTYRMDKPRRMIEVLQCFMAASGDIMGDPYTRDTQGSKILYCKLLPQLFEAFQQEGNRTIDNFNEVIEKVNETLQPLKEVCQRID